MAGTDARAVRENGTRTRDHARIFKPLMVIRVLLAFAGRLLRTIPAISKSASRTVRGLIDRRPAPACPLVGKSNPPRDSHTSTCYFQHFYIHAPYQIFR